MTAKLKARGLKRAGQILRQGPDASLVHQVLVAMARLDLATGKTLCWWMLKNTQFKRSRAASIGNAWAGGLGSQVKEMARPMARQGQQFGYWSWRVDKG